jgi:hypothetical protein
LAWIADLKNKFVSDKKIGLNFIRHTGDLMKQEAVIEKNLALQKRINDAANHFAPKFQAMQEAIKNHSLITEHRETATVINQYLNELYLALFVQNYYLQYCKEPFSVTSFLQHKIKFAQPRINISCYASGKKQANSDIPNAELYETLKRWRDMTCEENDLPIYLVANQNALKEIAAYLPFTKKDLTQLSGFGKAKAEKYGDDILDAVQDYCYRYNLESNMSAKEGNPKKERKPKSTEEKNTEIKTDTKTVSYNLYKEGKSVEEIAKERNLASSTIEGHLAGFVANGEIDLNKMVTPEKQNLIQEAAKIHGSESFKTLKENLPEDVSYGEIRMVIAAAKGDERA